ncbi:hypothetical protein F4553_008032 [Allocatelliglobosispora scoriae]|uniref:Helix-turn-helix domain-containing protein n=1 Tax=Allocatelliglobosispora scoriae TaxID=643052 RepID=A0A841C493_9ACTN|nr:helix-turn-helix domain-containing protein [Allocatelliglobosispora scoriae]MBB5874598.1 hypothetical protein [Allocatelliglobosispora scoriae]
MTHDQHASVRHWTDLIRRIRFTNAREGMRGATLKGVALMLATYADSDGTRIFPGNARISVDCEVDYRTARSAIATLHQLGLLVLVRKATRDRNANEYRLAIPEDLLEQEGIEVWSPTQYEAVVNKIKKARQGETRPAKDAKPTKARATAPQDTPRPADTEPAGHAVLAVAASAGHAVSAPQDTPCPPTYQGPVHNTYPPTMTGVVDQLAVTRASGPAAADAVRGTDPAAPATVGRKPRGEAVRHAGHPHRDDAPSGFRLLMLAATADAVDEATEAAALQDSWYHRQGFGRSASVHRGSRDYLTSGV